jgi:cytochrome c biogenesis protein CcmG/thiol:disulfide interchange protein DsbE
VERDEPHVEATGGWSRGRIVGIGLGVLLAAGIVTLLIVGLVNRDDDLSIDRTIAEGKAAAAPDFTLPVLFAGGDVGPEGSRLSLSSLRGRPVVVNMWASWCPPCKEEAPILQRLWTRYGPRGVVVLGVNTQDLTSKAKAFISEYKLTFPSVRDGTDDVPQSYGTTNLPETFVIDPDGKMRFLPVRGGLNAASERQIAEHLDRVLGS